MFNLSIRILVTKSSADNTDRLLSKEKSININTQNAKLYVGKEFIDLARSVYLTNDQRFDTKRQINLYD